MKKAFALVLTIALIATLTVASFAAVPAANNQDLTAKYNSELDETALYSLDVIWDSNMTFVYSAGTADWDPEAGAYVPTGDAGWKDDSVTIGVVNHSNRAVDATVSVKNYIDGVSVAVDGQATQQVATAVGTAVGNAPSVSFELIATGTPEGDNLNNAKVATATVNLKKVA